MGRSFVEACPQPVDLRSLHRQNPDRYPFILQSTASGPELGRFDILFACPGDALVLDQLATLDGPGADSAKDFFDALDSWWSSERLADTDSPLPFVGGWFLYLGYELAAHVEPSLQLEPDKILPTAFAVRCPAALITEHASNQTFIVCEQEHAACLADIHADLAEQKVAPAPDRRINVTVDEEQPEYFLQAVRHAKSHVAAGDVYQANLSRAWHATVSDKVSADNVYEHLCAANPAPFAGKANWRGKAVISSSPERLISVRGGQASTRPIAGTRPRGSDYGADNALSEELFGNSKERAEHVMLIDLERNDLGRICKPGSVEVNEYMVLESYAHVHHIVSNVRGELLDDVTPGGAIRAVFPGGTITGCPKVRCMQIISELEHSPRGAYTGSFGYLNRDGSMDLNILIRTMVMDGNRLELRAGSGIVADSEPEAELAETRAKAKGLLMALT